MAKKNANLHAAKTAKNDEFYTLLDDINNELNFYSHHFKDKVVYCNCDDAMQSNFVKYFRLKFGFFGMKKLICTHYSPNDYFTSEPAYKCEWTQQDEAPVIGQYELGSGTKTQLKGNGDFRSEECVEILKESDIVVTNPPFSLFREFVSQLVEFDKKFLLVGNKNAITYKEIFPLIKENKLWLGINSPKDFLIPNQSNQDSQVGEPTSQSYQRFGMIGWFTNLTHNRRVRKMDFFREYKPELYPKYDNYDAINVDKVIEIPEDYDGVIGVPITFLDHYCPDQFEILGSQRWCKSQEVLDCYCGKKQSANDDFKTLINGKETYDRIFIKHKNPKKTIF